MTERASGSSEAQTARQDSSVPRVPCCVGQALKNSTDFACFRRSVFRFLRLFLGKNNTLGRALLQKDAKDCGLTLGEGRGLGERDQARIPQERALYLSILGVGVMPALPLAFSRQPGGIARTRPTSRSKIEIYG